MRKYGLMATVLLFAMASLVFMSACEGVFSTPEKRYLAARQFFNDNVEDYNIAYKAASAETKAKWKANIDPIVKKAALALDAWKNVLYLTGGSAESKEADWLAVKQELVDALFRSGLIEVEGG